MSGKAEAQREGRSRGKRHRQEKDGGGGGERRRNEQKEQKVERKEMRREERVEGGKESVTGEKVTRGSSSQARCMTVSPALRIWR